MKRLVLVLILMTGACFGDLLVGPTPNIAPRLFIDVSVLHRAQPSYLVDVALHRGSDAEGRPRSLIDSSIIVEDSAVFGVPTSAFTLHYNWSEAVAPPGGRDTITVRGPIIAGLQSSGFLVGVPVPVRDGPYFREHVAGEDLVFTVWPLPDSIDGLIPLSQQWRLEIQDERNGREILELTGSGPYPSPLSMPWQFLPAAPGDSLSASLTFFSAHQAATSTYVVPVLIRGGFNWQLRIVAP